MQLDSVVAIYIFTGIATNQDREQENLEVFNRFNVVLYLWV